MIRTLHLTNAYHAHSGGIGTFYRALIDEANRTGRSMRLIVPSERHAVEEVGEHARVFHVRAPRSPWIDPRYRVLFPSQFLLPWRRLVRTSDRSSRTSSRSATSTRSATLPASSVGAGSGACPDPCWWGSGPKPADC